MDELAEEGACAEAIIPPPETLLKYDKPVLIGKSTDPSKKQPSSPQQFTDGTSNRNTLKILNSIFPPREWMQGDWLCVQYVSSAPSARVDIIQLEEKLDTELSQRQARSTGICPIRRELYTQCFDELIRQVTTNCAERGLLMDEVRREINMTLHTYKTLYASSITYGISKAFQAEQAKAEMEQKNAELEKEIHVLQEELKVEKAKLDEIEKRERDKVVIQRNNYMEEIKFMKEINKNLQDQLDETEGGTCL
ncbi:axonemal dynein light intermediate polypeptide 1-like [Antennarius striatus]|uniref:axonemal dynein light intermediate polypeptide 1-like n=1 Tax=Antennarius striatus TaxID=241820 RepID=UPI0035ADCBBE